MSSEVYQVDLVAALFGGFMVIWLATASESEQPSAVRHQHYAVLEMAVDQGAGLVAVLPSSLLERSCVPDAIAGELRQSLGQQVFSCSRFNRPLNVAPASLLDGVRFTSRFRYAFLDDSPSTIGLATQLVTSIARVLEVRAPQMQLTPLGYAYQGLLDRGAAFRLTPTVAEAMLFSCTSRFTSCVNRGTVEHRQTSGPVSVWSVQNPEPLRRLNRLTLIVQETASGPGIPTHPFVYDRIYRGRVVDQRMAAAGEGQADTIVSAASGAAQLSPGQMLRLTAGSVGINVGQPIQARLCILGPSGKQCFITRPGATIANTIELERG